MERSVPVRRGGSWFRRIGALAASVGLATQIGCYTYRPTMGVTPATGTTVRVALTDAGRALLTDQLGESIDWVQGTLAGADSTTYTVDVTLTRGLRGSYATWFGDRVQIPTRGVAQVTSREFSRQRSTALAIGITAGLVVLARAISLQVFGDGKPGDGGPCVPPACPDA